MTLISILIGILIDRFYEPLPALRRYDRFFSYESWMRERLPGNHWDGPLGVVAVVAPLAVLVILIQGALTGGIWSLLGLVFAIAVLVFTLGPRDLALDVAHYQQACDDDDTAARERQAAYFQPGMHAPTGSYACDEAVLRGIVVGANDRWFGVLFWFALLGPLGAVLFRAAVLMAERPTADGYGGAVSQFNGIMGWAPSRLMALSYALSGHFEDAMRAWKAVPPGEGDISAHTEAVLFAVGEGALSTTIADELRSQPLVLIRAAMGLVWRTLVVWLVVIALLILTGWAS